MNNLANRGFRRSFHQFAARRKVTKILLARMSVATCDQPAGTSTPRISKIGSPLRIPDDRITQLMSKTDRRPKHLPW